MSALVWGDVLADTGTKSLTGTLAPEILLPPGTLDPSTLKEALPDQALDVSSWDGLMIQVHSKSNVAVVFMPIEITIAWYSSLPRTIDPNVGFATNRIAQARIRKWGRTDTSYYVKNRGPYALIWVGASLAQNTPGTAQLIVTGTNAEFSSAGPYTPTVGPDPVPIQGLTLGGGGTAAVAMNQDYLGWAEAHLTVFAAQAFRLQLGDGTGILSLTGGAAGGAVMQRFWLDTWGALPSFIVVGPAAAGVNLSVVGSPD